MRKSLNLILFLMILLIFSSYLFINAEENKTRSKLLIFSHQFHIEDAEMSCADCHESIETSTKAEDRHFPDMDACANCHDVEDDENCNMCHPDLDNIDALPNPHRNFNFNHKEHVTEEKLGCEKCHSGIENVDLGDGKMIPTRESCNTCHNGLAASMECFICHSEGTKLRPDSHTPTWTREHVVQLRSGGSDCGHCHTNNYCQGCHESTDLISTKILPENFYTNYSPQASGEQSLILKTVHELNYRYVHQLDASGKEKDCRVCHETSTYCSECHNSAGFVKPAWHAGLDWGAIAMGVGSGGGRHAELARRDIERCAACHDVGGADPSCLMCHADFDGIKYTDPKTHDSGFSNRFSSDSDFHNDDGAMCFTCHTNSHQPGFGFCGYCHGGK